MPGARCQVRNDSSLFMHNSSGSRGLKDLRLAIRNGCAEFFQSHEITRGPAMETSGTNAQSRRGTLHVLTCTHRKDETGVHQDGAQGSVGYR